jgi:EAL domain-containing protein (putative c-di-GMP-specific phosphodiesterase class I)
MNLPLPDQNLAPLPPIESLSTEELGREFKNALQNHELSLNYQPIVNLETGLIIGFETLMRWTHPIRGRISPGVFIPVAEQTGLIVEASKWALKEAIAALKRLESHVGHNENIYMSVNFSPNELSADSFLDEMYNVISASDVRPIQIQLEITGELLSIQSDKAKNTLDICRKTGLKIAIDDYGIGTPEVFFPYMDNFPISSVKIDHLVIKELTSKPEAENLVRLIIEEARKRKIEIIAEGIEHKEEVHKLVALGCRFGQGYHFTKPLPERELTALLLNISGFSEQLK